MEDVDKEHYPINQLGWINPYEKLQMGSRFNRRESLDFCDICFLGTEQILKCYGHVHREISNLDLMYLCGSCKYSCHHGFSADYLARISRAQHPYFINDIAEIVDSHEDAGCFVYFITDGEFVKIGIAEDVQKRLAGIQTGNPRKVSVLFSIPVKSVKAARVLERQLHNAYSEFAKCGEWFDILNFIDVKEFQEYFS